MHEDLHTKPHTQYHTHAPVHTEHQTASRTAFLVGVISSLVTAVVIAGDIFGTTSVFVVQAPLQKRITHIAVGNTREVKPAEKNDQTPSNDTGSTVVGGTGTSTVAISAYQAFSSARETLDNRVDDTAPETANRADESAECTSRSVPGPWDNPGWIGDMPGCNDPTPGVIKMFFAPILGGGGGASAGASSGGAPGPGDGSGGSDGGGVGGGAPGGGPPGGGPPGGGGPSL